MGGRLNAPPPPSRRWKIQRPSRVRVNVQVESCAGVAPTLKKLGGHVPPLPPRLLRHCANYSYVGPIHIIRFFENFENF